MTTENLTKTARRPKAMRKCAGALSGGPKDAICARMSYDELIEFVMSTTPEEWLADDESGVFLCKSNLNVRIVRAKPEERIFEEEWAMKFPAKEPHPQGFTLWYGASRIKAYAFVAVDGFRSDLPLPRINTMDITSEQYAIANIVNLADDVYGDYYRRYIRRFNVTDEPPTETHIWD